MPERGFSVSLWANNDSTHVAVWGTQELDNWWQKHESSHSTKLLSQAKPAYLLRKQKLTSVTGVCPVGWHRRFLKSVVTGWLPCQRCYYVKIKYLSFVAKGFQKPFHHRFMVTRIPISSFAPKTLAHLFYWAGVNGGNDNHLAQIKVDTSDLHTSCATPVQVSAPAGSPFKKKKSLDTPMMGVGGAVMTKYRPQIIQFERFSWTLVWFSITSWIHDDSRNL